LGVVQVDGDVLLLKCGVNRRGPGLARSRPDRPPSSETCTSAVLALCERGTLKRHSLASVTELRFRALGGHVAQAGEQLAQQSGELLLLARG